MFAGVVAGFLIGVVASLLGVAGGELLIPTLVLLFGADIKLAGSLSLAVSLPTMLVGFARYSRDQSFSVIRPEPHVSAGHGRGFDPGNIYRGPIARRSRERVSASCAGRNPYSLGCEGLEARVNLHDCALDHEHHVGHVRTMSACPQTVAVDGGAANMAVGLAAQTRIC